MSYSSVKPGASESERQVLVLELTHSVTEAFRKEEEEVENTALVFEPWKGWLGREICA